MPPAISRTAGARGCRCGAECRRPDPPLRTRGAVEMTGRYVSRCPNYHHGRATVTVRHRPNCGEVVDASILKKLCDPAAHSQRRRNGHDCCVDCGLQLRRGT